MSKEWILRYLLPLTGLALTLLLSVVFFYLPRLLFRGASEIGFKELPFPMQMALTPYALPVSSLCLCALFVGSAFAPDAVVRAVLSAVGLVTLVLFVLFGTACCAWIAGAVQIGEMLRAMQR